jgi:hypothetical protein
MYLLFSFDLLVSELLPDFPSLSASEQFVLMRRWWLWKRGRKASFQIGILERSGWSEANLGTFLLGG